MKKLIIKYMSSFLLGAIKESLKRLPCTPYDFTKVKSLTNFNRMSFWYDVIPDMIKEEEGNFSCIGEMTNLHTLVFSNFNGDTFKVNDFSFLEKCQKLKKLDVRNTNFSDCTFLLPLSNLHQVFLPKESMLCHIEVIDELVQRGVQVNMDRYIDTKEKIIEYKEDMDLFKLTGEIYKAVKTILLDLYKNNEHYYYITLVSDGGASTPCISAWSYEALERSSDDEKEKEMIKWSYADSPYCCWKQEEFDKVNELFCARANIWDLEDEEFEIEYEKRFSAMEEAIKQLDKEGLFEINQDRMDVVVLVEVAPPNVTNTERAYRMNNEISDIFNEWLEEAAE